MGQEILREVEGLDVVTDRGDDQIDIRMNGNLQLVGELGERQREIGTSPGRDGDLGWLWVCNGYGMLQQSLSVAKRNFFD